jgi:splicing factor U2AF subunit
VQDIRDECVVQGEVVSIEVPRPGAPGEQVAGLGKVFVQFDTVQSSEKAMNSLGGRMFGTRRVVPSFLPLERYLAKDFGPGVIDFK